jgi:8-oxo-dGTP pyrophosphatase MutT (NUDIX family)
MAKVVIGDRVAKQARLRLGCTAAIFNTDSTKILLTKRRDNNLWCLPGGGMDPGEDLAECCIREVYEETGLRVTVSRLIGVYSSPNVMIEYRDGNKAHIVAMLFEANIIGGELGLSDEVIEFGYFEPSEIDKLELMFHHRVRINDAFSHETSAFIR